MPTPPFPKPFLEIRSTDVKLPPHLRSLCAGFDLGKWRRDELITHLLDWLPGFCLTEKEWADRIFTEPASVMVQAAQRLYTTEKYQRRGEIGELLLHIICRQVFETVPVVCKLVYKSAYNDTVKGFDMVHMVPAENELGAEIWLGESKFYIDPQAAIREAYKSVVEHLDPAFLKQEKSLIANKIPDDLPNREAVTRAFSDRERLETLITHGVFPILVAYDSNAVRDYGSEDAYLVSLEKELLPIKKFAEGAELPHPITVHLFAVPLGDKEDFQKTFDARLKGLFP